VAKGVKEICCIKKRENPEKQSLTFIDCRGESKDTSATVVRYCSISFDGTIHLQSHVSAEVHIRVVLCGRRLMAPAEWVKKARIMAFMCREERTRRNEAFLLYKCPDDSSAASGDYR